MVLINNLTIDEINAALIRLQRSQTEVVGGEKGATINNITVNNESSGGGGYTTDYSSLLKRITTRLEGAEKGISSNEKNISKQEAKNKEQQQQIEEIEALLNGLTSLQITQFSFDEETRTLYLVTADSAYEVSVPSETVTLELNTTTNKLTFTMGEQEQEVTLPYINSSEKGTANGVATLDGQGRVPYSQLPESAMEFLGQWNASTNTPHLADGTGTNGDFYIVSTGGTVNLGTEQNPHIITFSINDRIVYEGDIAQWVRLPAGQVSSVNGQSGDVTLTASDIEYSTGVSIKDKIDANAVQSDWNVTDTTSLAYIKNKPSVSVLGDTVGCGLGTASAGSCTTAARSDHVHPIPYWTWIANRVGNCGLSARWSSGGYVCLYATNSVGTCTNNNVRVRYADCSGTASSSTNATDATNATNATLVKLQGDGTANPDTDYSDSGIGIYKAINYNIGWVSNDGMIIHIPWSTSYAFQIAVDNQSNWMAVRSKAPPAVGQPGVWSNWAQVITADNIGSQSVACATSSTCATTVNRYLFNTAYDFDLALFDGTACATSAYLYVGAKCRATFNTNTGVLTAKCFCGIISNATSADNVDGYHADISSAYNLIRVTKASDVGSGANGYYAGMTNLNAGDGTKWWHILSMDWGGNDPNNWQSQLLLPTQDGGVPKYRRNNSGGIAITSSTWHYFITDENIANQCVAYATFACNADRSSETGCLTDGTVVGVAECTNEFNIYPTAGHMSWLNYRGGVDITLVGDGSGTGGLGTLRAGTVCANDFVGVASSLLNFELVVSCPGGNLYRLGCSGIYRFKNETWCTNECDLYNAIITALYCAFENGTEVQSYQDYCVGVIGSRACCANNYLYRYGISLVHYWNHSICLGSNDHYMQVYSTGTSCILTGCLDFLFSGKWSAS